MANDSDKEPKKKRDFSLNNGAFKSVMEGSKLQQAKGDLMNLSKAIDEQKENKEEEPKAPVEESTDALEEELLKEDSDDLDIAAGVDAYADATKKLQKMMMSKQHQEAVERMCEPMSVLNILQKGEFRQKVPVVKDQFTVEFRSMSADEDLALKKIMAGYEDVTDRYFWDLYTLYQQAVCVVSINDMALPSHLGSDGKVSEEKLNTKLKYILSMPIQLTAVIGMHLCWFDLRVRKLFNIDVANGELKNG